MTARGRRLAALGRATVKTVIALLAIALMVVAAAAVSLRTDWAKNELRNLLVAQANRYLIGTLEIGRLEGSLYEGVELRDVRLLRSGRAVVEVEAVRVTYGIRQLFQPTTSIRELRLTRPRVYAVKENDGRWNLATLVQRQTPPAQPQGPPRAFHIGSIEITDGTVELASPVTFGAVRVPTRFDDLDASFSLDRTAEGWRVSFEQASWAGATPDLAVTRFAGSLAGDGDGLLFDRLAVETPRSAFTLDGRLHRGGATTLNLRVSADRFAFQEWAGIVSGLRNIAVEA
jgi:hypothetical protein